MWVIFVSGLVGGGLYLAISLGVVLTFRFAHTLNFAHGAVATLGSYAAWQLVSDGHSVWLGWLAAIGVGAVSSLALGTVIARYFADAPELITTMATFGPTLAIIGFVGEQWGHTGKAMSPPEILSGTVSIFGANVGRFEFAVLVVMLLLVGTISLLLKRTRTGLALRALADDPATAAVNGIAVLSLERLVWAIGGGLAGLAGVAISTAGQLDPHYLTSFLIAAFTAVVVGGIGTLSGLVVGCLVYGVLVAFISYYLGGQYVAVTSLLLLAVLYLVRPTGLLGHQTLLATNGLPAQSESLGSGRVVIGLTKLSSSLRRVGPRAPRSRTVLACLAAVVAISAAVVVPVNLTGTVVFVLATMLAMFIAVSGQNVASGTSGRLAVAQGGFMMLGGYSAAILISKMGMSPLLALLVSVPVGAVCAAVVGVSTIRLSGIYLGIITLQFTLAVPELARSFDGITGGEVGTFLPPLEAGGRVASSTYDIWIYSLAVTVVWVAGIALFGRSRMGLRVRAARDSEGGAESIGLDVPWLRVAAVVTSGAGGALAGALSSFQTALIAPESFGLWTSVTILLAAAIAGQDSLVVGPIIGAAFVVLLPYALAESGGWAAVVFGLSATAILAVRRVTAKARMLMGHEATQLGQTSDSAMPPSTANETPRVGADAGSAVEGRNVP